MKTFFYRQCGMIYNFLSQPDPVTRTLVCEAQRQDMGCIHVYKLPARFFADFCKRCLVGISGAGWSSLQYLDSQFFG